MVSRKKVSLATETEQKKVSVLKHSEEDQEALRQEICEALSWWKVRLGLRDYDLSVSWRTSHKAAAQMTADLDYLTAQARFDLGQLWEKVDLRALHETVLHELVHLALWEFYAEIEGMEQILTDNGLEISTADAKRIRRAWERVTTRVSRAIMEAMESRERLPWVEG